MPENYVPERGDIVWLNFDPHAGHEQAGRRPAIVVSPLKYNRKVGLALFCPITSRTKGYAFEILLPDNLPVTGAILTDQIKSLDWRVRKVEYAGKLPASVVTQVLTKLITLIR